MKNWVSFLLLTLGLSTRWTINSCFRFFFLGGGRLFPETAYVHYTHMDIYTPLILLDLWGAFIPTLPLPPSLSPTRHTASPDVTCRPFVVVWPFVLLSHCSFGGSLPGSILSLDF